MGGGTNGHPSWHLLEVLDRNIIRLHERSDRFEVRMLDRMERSEIRIHERIDGLRGEIITIQATMAEQRRLAPRGRLARAKALAERVAALRELLLLLCLAIAGLTAVVQAPEIKSGLREAAGLIASHRSLHLKPSD